MVGVFLVAVSLAVFGYIVFMAYTDMDLHVVAEIKESFANRNTRGQPVKKGDIIIRAANGSQKVLNPEHFAEHFELAHERSSDQDGFRAYRASAKLYAHELSDEEVSTHFPAGKFFSMGTLVAVKPGDVLMMPFPGGGELHRLDKPTFQAKYSSAFSRDSNDDIQRYIRSQAETLAHWDHKIKATGAIYRKTGKILAKVSEADGVIETTVNGVCEARKPYEQGDFIIIGSRGGRCVTRIT